MCTRIKYDESAPIIHKDRTKVSTSSISVQIRVRTDSGVHQNHANEAAAQVDGGHVRTPSAATLLKALNLNVGWHNRVGCPVCAMSPCLTKVGPLLRSICTPRALLLNRITGGACTLTIRLVRSQSDYIHSSLNLTCLSMIVNEKENLKA